MNLPDLTGWVPIRVYWRESRPMVDWCYVGERRFTEPFFEQTITKVLRHPFHSLFRHQTPIESLSAWSMAHLGLPPTGFIFHMSRCGSTLISQMLAALPQNITISEAGPIDSVLRANRHGVVSDDQRVLWLQSVVNALGQRRLDAQKHYFIKFDCWHTLELPLIQRAFPGVPWIFVYREPVEVLASQLRQPGSWTLPGALDPGAFGMDAASVARLPRDEYCSRVLATICEAALLHSGNAAMMTLNYRQLPDAVHSSMAALFRVVYSATDIDRMRYVSRFDAKNPSLFFADESSAKRAQAGDRSRELAARWLASPHERMESLNRGHPIVC